MNTRWTDRSRILAYQRCPRRRFHEYHDGPEGMGIVPRKTPLPLAVGSAVHAGLAMLLREGQRYMDSDKYAYTDALHDIVSQRSIEDLAVKTALAELATHADGLELDLSEQAGQSNVTDQTLGDLGASLGVDVNEAVGQAVMDAKAKFDAYLWQEQSALVEGMVRAYARRRLKPLLQQYEVLEVEREGDWLLYAGEHEWVFDDPDDPEYSPTHCKFCGRKRHEDYTSPTQCFGIRFASRPDALLLDRESRQLYIQSFKTAASWDIRKERDAERDMQGLSEGVEVERRLAEWHALIHNPFEPDNGFGFDVLEKKGATRAVFDYLRAHDAPPRILGIRMEYMFKGDRWRDKDLTRELGIESRVQKSPLVRAYLNAGMAAGDEQWCWSYDYHKEDGSASKLYYKTWRPAAVWQHMPVRKWIEMLDDTVEAVGEEGRTLGWQGPAQASGFTSEHPLDSVFHPPIVVFRNDDAMRDWFEQTEAGERRVAEAVEQIRAESEPAERRHLLNVLMPQSTIACSYPSECPFIPICFGPEHVQREPMSTGRYKVRVPNHPVEVASGTEG